MLGYPGAGKTTVAEYIARVTDAVHINSDQFRLRLYSDPLNITEAEHENMYKLLDYITEQVLKNGKSVIYDANLNRYIHRKEKYDICKRTGATAKLVWVRTDQKTAMRRATEEAGSHPGHRPFGNMRKSVFNRLISQIEPPRKNEKPIEIDGAIIDPDQISRIVR